MHRAPRWPAYAAASWMAGLAIMHVYWASGGSIGLPDGTRARDNAVLFAIGVLAVPLFVLGTVAALAPVRPWGALVRPDRPVRMLCAAGILAFVHAAPTIADDLLDALGLLDLDLHTNADRVAHFVVEPFWMAGALLCGLAAAAASGGRTADQSRPIVAASNVAPTADQVALLHHDPCQTAKRSTSCGRT